MDLYYTNSVYFIHIIITHNLIKYGMVYMSIYQITKDFVEQISAFDIPKFRLCQFYIKDSPGSLPNMNFIHHLPNYNDI